MPTYGLNAGNNPFAAPGGTNPNLGANNVPKSGGPIQNPGNNLTNPGYSEQTFEHTQNRLLNDPAGGKLTGLADSAGTSGGAENFLGSNLGSLAGPGQGEQYWNQQQGQYMDPFAGEQFARQATQNYGAQGPASAFYDKSMGQYDQATGYNTQNAQGQYGQSSQQLAGGTQGEQGLGQIASNYSTGGTYNDQNRAGAQYEQTQGAFGDMPIANFDPFYDRARQLATQDYNRQSAGRGVYGSSEALSGVGNVITDIEAQRANRSFDAEMQRTQEQRARQQLLGEQARQGDLSATDAFGANLAGASTYANINNMQANQELGRHELLGNQANAADTQATNAQNARTEATSAFGRIASDADSAEARRYEGSTNAMNQADRTELDRMNAGADVAFGVDEQNRQNYTAEQNAAASAAQIRDTRKRTEADILDTASDNDLDRLREANNQAGNAERDRQNRQIAKLNATGAYSADMMQGLSKGLEAFHSGDKEAWEDYYNAQLAPKMQKAGFSQDEINGMRGDVNAVMQVLPQLSNAGGGGGGGSPTPGAANGVGLESNPYG